LHYVFYCDSLTAYVLLSYVFVCATALTFDVIDQFLTLTALSTIAIAHEWRPFAQLITSHSQRLNSGKPLGTGCCEWLWSIAT